MALIELVLIANTYIHNRLDKGISQNILLTNLFNITALLALNYLLQDTCHQLNSKGLTKII